jgi:hypothetical protein
MQQSAPQRYEQFLRLAERANQLVGVYKQQQVEQQTQRHAQQAQAFQQFADHHDKIFEERNKNIAPEQMRTLAQEAMGIFREYGVSEAEVQQHWKTNPLMRSAAAQQVLMDAGRWRQAQKAIARAAHRPVPQVQRPGVSQPHSSDDGAYAAIERQFRGKNLNAKQAADLLIARRNARS